MAFLSIAPVLQVALSFCWGVKSLQCGKPALATVSGTAGRHGAAPRRSGTIIDFHSLASLIWIAKRATNRSSLATGDMGRETDFSMTRINPFSTR
jgi:hypothetical protein